MRQRRKGEQCCGLALFRNGQYALKSFPRFCNSLMPSWASCFASAALPAEYACCQSINLQDCAVMRAARSNSSAKILPAMDFGLARESRFRCASICLSAARNFDCGDFGKPIQAVPAKQFALFRSRRSNDRAKRRFIRCLHAKLLVCET